MEQKVDVAIIGAGSAGLSAVSQIRKKTDNYLIINAGPYGTTCARVGCMPSKVFISVANDFHRRHVFAQTGINGAEALTVDSRVVMEHTRSLRDRFVRSVMTGPSGDKQRNMQGFARFIEPDLLDVNGKHIRAKAVVIATGSSPVVPDDWRKIAGKRLVTTDDFFELPELPKCIGVAGVGVIGLELGQALARLGIDVLAVSRNPSVGGLTDPFLIEYATRKLAEEFDLVVGEAADLKDENGKLIFTGGGRSKAVDLMLVALGRKPNLSGLGLEQLGVKLDKNGHPPFDRNTMQIGDLPVFYAGDVNGDRPLLHEASDEGRIAGYNALLDKAHCFKRRTPLAICFSDPNIGLVGKTYAEIKDRNPVIGEVSFEGQGRSLTMVKAKGHLRIYACPKSGAIWGAEMFAPYGEHLAHELAWMIQKEQTVFDMLKMPFYHPVVEEGVRTALREVAQKIGGPNLDIELARCGKTDLDPLC
jgi:dihydrolipoamide dehydrogenase